MWSTIITSKLLPSPHDTWLTLGTRGTKMTFNLRWPPVTFASPPQDACNEPQNAGGLLDHPLYICNQQGHVFY